MEQKKNWSDRLLYFQIGLVVALGLALLLMNYEAPMPEYVSSTTEVVGLEVVQTSPLDTANRILPPEAKK